MHWRIHEQHLLQHHFGKRLHNRKSKLIQVSRLGSAVGGVIHQDGHDLGIARDHPGVHIRIPVNGIECAQGMKEFIGGRNYFGLQQPKQAETFVIGAPCTYRGRLHGYVVRRHLDYSSNLGSTAFYRYR